MKVLKMKDSAIDELSFSDDEILDEDYAIENSEDPENGPPIN